MVQAYISAISFIHQGLGSGMTVSLSPAISALIKGIFTVRPPPRELVPELTYLWFYII